MAFAKDLTGQKFGRLTALKRIGNKGKFVCWLCRCDCDGKEIEVLSTYLLNGHTKSCGCYFIDNLKETRSKYNEYVQIDDESGLAYDLKNKKKELFLFDWNYLDKIKNYGWYNDGVYIAANNKLGNNGKIRLHRLIMSIYLNVPLDVLPSIDHINRKEFDNRIINLRPVTDLQNGWNKEMNKPNPFGVMGIYFDITRDKFQPNIMACGSRIWLGRYDKLEDAIFARLTAEKKYFGEYAPQRHLFEQYGII
jgi:hypothetical protein